MGKYDPVLKEHFLTIVDKQLRSKEVPEVEEEYSRLISEGNSKEEAKRLIAVILSMEMYCVLKYQRVFNKEKYVNALRNLPNIPDGYDSDEAV